MMPELARASPRNAASLARRTGRRRQGRSSASSLNPGIFSRVQACWVPSLGRTRRALAGGSQADRCFTIDLQRGGGEAPTFFLERIHHGRARESACVYVKKGVSTGRGLVAVRMLSYLLGSEAATGGRG